MSQDIYISVQPVTGEDVYVNVSPNLAGVLFVNGRDGIVVLNKSDVGLSNVENVSITGVSGYLQYQIDNLGTGYASQAEINLLSGLLAQTGSYLYTTITNLSGDIVSNYATKIELNNTGTFLYNLVNALSGYGNGTFATITNLATTGSNLNDKINNLSGYSNNTFATIVNLASTGQSLQNQINNLDLNYASQTEFNSLSGNLISTGANLQSQINSLYGSGFLTGVDLSPYYLKSNPSGYITSQNVLYTSGNQIKSGRLIIGDDASSIVDPNSQYTLSLQTNSPRTWLEILNNSGANKGVFFGIEGNNFEQYNWQGGDIIFFTAENVEAGFPRLTIKNDGKVGIGTNSPSEKLEVAGNVKADNLVYNTGDQIIFGTKYFDNSVYIHDLYVTGTEFIATVQNNFIESPYILLNLTGGAIDGGIFFVTGSGLTGVNDYGPIIGFDHTNKFKFGTARRSDDLSTLNDIAAVQDIQNYSGFVNGKYSTIINLESTGSNLNTKINNLSGYSNNTFATAINLGSTGSSLDTKINNYSGFVNSNFYGINNPSGYITGVNLSNYATTGQLNQASGNLQSQIDILNVNSIAYAIALG
jgi:hypothetical protein